MRLTEGKRNEIANAVANRKFNPQIDAAEKHLHKHALNMYDALFGKTAKKIADSGIPKEFFQHNNGFYVRKEGGISQWIALGETKVVPGGYITHTGDFFDDIDRYEELQSRVRYLCRQKDHYRHEIYTAVKSVSTVRSLVKNFPDLVPFIPESWTKALQNPPAPVDLIKTLDQKFGLAS